MTNSLPIFRIRYTVGVDSSWSWFVCFASFLVQFLVLGIQNSFGAFFVEFLKEFHEGESSTAWIGSVSIGLTFMNGPLATAMCARWGSRVITCLGATLTCCGLITTSFVTSFPWLFITYGLVFGLGSSFSYFASIAGLTSFFKKHLCLAYGISLAGSGVGTPVMIMGTEYLVGIYGWRPTFRFAGGICVVLFLCGLTYLPIETNNDKPKPSSKPFRDSSHSISKELLQVEVAKRPARPLSWLSRKLTKVFDPEPFKDCAFAIWVLALGFCVFGYFIPFVFVIRIAEDIGVSGTQSTLLIAYLAINQTVFKIVFGKLGDFARSKRILTLQLVLFIQAIATVLCPLATKYGYVVLVIYVVLFGVGDGCWSVMIGMGTELIVGKAMMPRAFGCLYGLISIPLILGPPVAGLIFDKFGSYDPAFILSGSTLIVGIALMFVVNRMIRKRLAQEKTEKALEVVMDSSDDNKVIVDFDDTKGTSTTHLDKQQLVPWRRRLLDEPYSRPSSLIISRLLEDAQFTDESPYCLSQQEYLVGNQGVYPVVTSLQKQSTHSIDSSHDNYRDKDTESIVSGDRVSLTMIQRDASGSINSDSGRSTGSEDTASLKSQRSSAGSTDTGFENDTLSMRSVSSPSTKNAANKNGTRYSTDHDAMFNSSCSLYSEQGSDSLDDIFSKLMEKALEIEKIYHSDNKIKCEELSSKRQGHSPFNWSQALDTRETVL